MQTFEFSLRRVLDWRRTQLDLEENKLRQQAASIEQLAVTAAKLDLSKGRAEQSVRERAAVEAADLWALAAYRQRLLGELRAVGERRKAAEQQLAAQRQKVLEAQRECRLLEKLEGRRQSEWQRQADQEVESLAAESFLAGRNRQRR